MRRLCAPQEWADEIFDRHAPPCSDACAHSEWTTFEGETLLVCQLEDGHLRNLHRYLLERALDISGAFRSPVGFGDQLDAFLDELESRREFIEELLPELEQELEQRRLKPHPVLRPPEQQPIYKGAYER